LKKISDKDKKAWIKFIESKDKVYNKDNQNIKNKIIRIEKTIDLHGFTLEKANLEIDRFISKCFDGGVNKINIITGKGTRSKNKEDPYQSKDLGILKYSVPNYIKENEILMKKILKINFDDVENPSKGSFDIELKKKNEKN
jgi:DNA-nicking Smr family endonuclease|tara:strand:- start:605 stop:1027 length:423 start_codon:yes stop_codon:yes gene_type:complete